ncbi:hypothetical protein ENBRE01_1735 [Enteropsectra breve]|nr:hypothetical protein ENBRE01_1735 [Enteropsectra breve]
MMAPNTEPEQIIKQAARDYQLDNPTLGTIKCEPQRLHVNSTVPLTSKPYDVPFKIRDAMKNEIQRLLDEGIIIRSTSTYASPAFGILKRNGDLRLVVDYRRLNSITVKDTYPFPSVWTTLRTMVGATVFTQLDLRQGYHQIPLDSRDRHYTSFVLPIGQFEYTRLPFGLTNAPRAFQRILAGMLEDFTFALVFLDDIIIFSPDRQSHAKHVTDVLTRLKSQGVALNFDKSSFMQEEVTYLGCIISKEGIKPNTSRVPDIDHISRPRTRRELLKILGFINWFRPFIKSLSTKIETLKVKTSKKAEFHWNDSDQAKLQKNFQEIKSQPTPFHPDFEKPFELHTDASDAGIRAVLTQQNNIVGLFSRKYITSQHNYTVTEKEFLAIVEGLEYFRQYLFNSPVTVFTDHVNNIFDTDNISKRVQRWKTLLCDYDYTIIYRKGLENGRADGLSRLLFIKKENINENFQKKILTHSEGLVLLKGTHENLSHPGEKQLYLSTKDVYHIPGIKELCKSVTKCCAICQQNKNFRTNYGKLDGELGTDVPFQDISSDIYGPINYENTVLRGEETSISLLTITDRCTRWTIVEPLKDITTQSILRVFEKRWLKRFPLPKTFLTDQGRPYISKQMEEQLALWKIKHLLSPPYHPQSNGISERINQTIARVLRCYPTISIKEACRRAEAALQQASHRSLGTSPWALVHGHHPLDERLQYSQTNCIMAVE